MKKRARYPSISLGDAIERVEKIYRHEGRNAMSSDVAAQHLGYSGLNGASLSVLAAMKKYGLLEGRADDIRVSDDAVIIISDRGLEDQAERADALTRALIADPVFKELHDRFGNRTTEINVSSFLQKKGFNPTAAKSAAKYYLESVTFVDDEIGDYTISNIEEEEPSSMQPKSLGAPDIPHAQYAQHTVLDGNYNEAPLVISGVSNWPIIRIPKKFTAKNWDDMIAILNVMKGGFITENTENNPDSVADAGSGED